MNARYPILSYVRHAYRNWWNYSALGLGLALALISGNWAWLMITAGLELAYLYMQSGNPRFQRHVDSLLEDAREHDVAALRDRLLKQIAPEYRNSYMHLEEEAERLDSEDITAAQRRDLYYQENNRKVKRLLMNYLQLASAVTRYDHYLATADERKLHEDIARLTAERTSAEERLAEIKQKNIDVLTKRLERLQKGRANRDYLSAQLETIEDTLQLVVEQAITLSDPKGSSMQIDNLLGNLEETELLASEMDAYLELQDGMLDEVTDTRGSLRRGERN